MKEDTAIVQLVIFDDQLGASFIYCSPVLKLICLDQELVRGMRCKHKHVYSALIIMRSVCHSLEAYSKKQKKHMCGWEFAM